MLHALPSFRDGNAFLEFDNCSIETVKVIRMVAFPKDSDAAGMPLESLTLILTPGERVTVNVSLSLLKFLRHSNRESARLLIHLSLEPNVNLETNEGTYIIATANGVLADFSARKIGGEITRTKFALRPYTLEKERCIFMEVSIQEAKTKFSTLLQRVALGEEIIIAKAGVPVAKLVPVYEEKPKRVLGFYKGRIWIAEDFDEPLPDDFLAAFYGEDTAEVKPAKRAPAKKRKKG